MHNCYCFTHWGALVTIAPGYSHTTQKKQLTDSEKSTFQALIERRSMGVPVAYITGYKEFFGLNLQVNESVLVPTARYRNTRLSGRCAYWTHSKSRHPVQPF